MGKRMSTCALATLCLAVFVLATAATVQQVSAIYTLGDQLPYSVGESNAGGLPLTPVNTEGNGLPLYPSQYQSPGTGTNVTYPTGGHVPGHQAFVLPGSLYIPPSDQQQYYSPDGAIITGTQGDLFVYICVSDFTNASSLPGTPSGSEQGGPINISWRYPTTSPGPNPGTAFQLSRYLYIAIPPEFTPPVAWAAGWNDLTTVNQGLGDTSNIETTITNDHNMIMTGQFSPRHPVAPNWWFIRITAEPRNFPASQVAALTDLNQKFNPKYTTDTIYQGSSGFLYPPNMDPWLDRQISPKDTNGVEKNFAGCYRIKILNMKAPTCVGKYFFKIFYTSTNQPAASIGILPWQADGTLTTSTIYGTKGGWPNLWQEPNPPNPPYSTASPFTIDPWSGYLNNYFEKFDTFEPENYPVILVKG